jgi:hypothetical protein
MHDFSHGLTYVIILMFLGEVLDLKNKIMALKIYDHSWVFRLVARCTIQQ